MDTIEQKPSRCILVLGTGRSGTSAVGGALSALGVRMGDTFIKRDNTNPWGTYEDGQLFSANRQIMSGGLPPEAYRPLIEYRNQRPVWGWKDPGLVWTLEHALPYLEDVRVIFTHRPRGQCILSARRAYSWNLEQANDWYQAVGERVQEWREVFQSQEAPPFLDVTFSLLLSDTKATVKRISGFAFDGLEQPTRYKLGKAERHIRT